MLVVEAPLVDVRPMLPEERRLLVELLASMSDAQWTAPTALPAWRVKDIALHLLDDDLGRLSRDRDHDDSGLIDVPGGYHGLVMALNKKNQRWVEAASGLSRRAVAELLAWSGGEIDRWSDEVALDGDATVAWASDDRVPTWFDLARELTERWVHQQQIRDALRRPDAQLDELTDVVLGTFVWAFPHQYRVVAPTGTTVALRLGDTSWTLTRLARRWDLEPGGIDHPDAACTMSADAAWRLLTGGAVDLDAVERDGPDDLVLPLFRVRAAIV